MAKKNKIKILLSAAVAVILSLVGIVYYIHSSHYVYTDDAYISGHSVYMCPHIEGYVKTINVKDNQFVKKGQLLLTIDERDYSLALKSDEDQLIIAKTTYKMSQHLAKLAYTKLLLAKLNYIRDKKLINFHSISTKQYQNSEAVYQELKSNLASKILKTKINKQNIKKLQDTVANAKLNLSYTKIYAPFDGWITKKSIAIGSYVKTGQALLAIVPTNLWITANYKETKITHLRKGEEVSIHIDAYPDLDFKGHINSIQSGTGSAFSLLPPENATGNFVKIVQRIPVKIVFDKIPDPDKYKLSIGMSVETTAAIN
ncbi:MAG TPA: HlyD family secretion protein [Victivallales bacterium]|nr:HlyD family secretion protein [Victivallales bacterium]